MTGLRAACAALVVLALLLPSASVAQAPNLVGEYAASGRNPGGEGEYRGDVAIARTGDLYQVVWSIGGQRHIGTGILRDDVLSVVYQPVGAAPGVAVYEIGVDGVLEGTWTSLGGTSVGMERLVPKGRL